MIGDEVLKAIFWQFHHCSVPSFKLSYVIFKEIVDAISPPTEGRSHRSAVAGSQLWNRLHLNFVITFLYFLSDSFCPILLTLAFLLHLPFLWHGCSLPPHEESCPSSTDLKVINEIGFTGKLQDLHLSSVVSTLKRKKQTMSSRLS